VPTINNAAPMTIFNGIKDDSTVAVTQTPITVPDHCPLFFIYAQKGRNGAILTGGASLTQEYGTASLDDTQQYYNHQTALLDLVNAAGNACYVCRMMHLRRQRFVSRLICCRLLCRSTNVIRMARLR
jgi:hypothetical protein